MLINVVTMFLQLTHNQISQGCLDNKSSISLLVGLGYWSLMVGYQPAYARYYTLLIPQAFMLCLNNMYAHMHPWACSCTYISGKAFVPMHGISITDSYTKNLGFSARV